MIHLGIIPDGNRRYTRKIGEDIEFGYNKCFEIIQEIMENTLQKNKLSKLYEINKITLFICSKDNLLKRSKKEVDIILKMIGKFIQYYKISLKKLIKQYQLRINIIGNLNLLPENLQKELKYISKQTKKYNFYILNLAIGYDGREEIIKGIKKFNKTNEQLSIKNFYQNLQLKSDIDIVIRTGYEKRMSGFFPWQTIYAEWFFLDKYWPEITIDDIIDVIKEYHLRKKNFGK